MVSDQKFARSRTAKLMQRPDMSMDSLKDIETVDINDVLKQMGQQKQDPPDGSDPPDEQK